MKYMLIFLIVAIIILWVIRVLVRLIFPAVIRNAFSNMQNPSTGNSYQKPRRPEGSISIDFVPQKKKKGNSDKLGEFVEYEDVK
ncbi:DUF4834 domain-containing protein [Pedobacter montanisoli]|uniref:DUF4834 domain-containing protein n=1 Tax=Pedobacter montanisoli TaxID=2923277 RepID=A0ABS9ZUH3_9SPHI|nr:DUF4834 domain-containing protein [Pedobacter montanisoli]MCJ0742017.1 DUF4834 domain-containing protein [Pedobacter montanisoli]